MTPIQIKFFGGAKKSFMRDQIMLDRDSITIAAILEYLVQNKPKDTIPLDMENTLVAVNGVDTSALGGRGAVVVRGDTVSIIPVIHGGADMRLEVEGNLVEIFCMSGSAGFNHTFIDELRKKYDSLTIQGVSAKFVLGRSHIQKILYLVAHSRKNGITLARKYETDILARFANTTQISQAIALAGISRGEDFVLIAMGQASELDRLHSEIRPHGSQEQFQWADRSSLMDVFGITSRHMQAVDSDDPLEDILVEGAATLS